MSGAAGARTDVMRDAAVTTAVPVGRLAQSTQRRKERRGESD
jgi:hypothetical protein